MRNQAQVSYDFSFSSVKAKEDDKLIINGMASTTETDRMGDIVTASAWANDNALRNFKNNPILLFNHDYNRPIGKVTETYATQFGLEVTAEISKAAEPSLYGLIGDKVLSTFSIGFMIKDARYAPEEDIFYITEVELLELSCVSVPANAGCTFNVVKGYDGDYSSLRKNFGNERPIEGSPSMQLKLNKLYNSIVRRS